MFVPGVWGPYFSAMIPDLYLSEGGQSSTGQLVIKLCVTMCIHYKSVYFRHKLCVCMHDGMHACMCLLDV